MSQTSLMGLTLLKEKQRKMKKGNYKFVFRAVFPLGLECSIWGSTP